MAKHTHSIGRQKPTNCLNVFDHFVGLAFKGLWFSNINVEIQGKNGNDYETEYASIEDPLNMNITVIHETTLISGIPNMINEKNFQI